MVGQKVSIVSDKAQTTRKRILGILTTGAFQIVFADTPGIQGVKHKFNQILNETARQTLDGVDCILMVVDVSRHPGKEDEEVAQLVSSSAAPKVLCLNKMDLLKPALVEDNHNAYLKLVPGAESMMTCMTKAQNSDLLLGLVLENCPEGPPLYPAETISDQTERSRAAEFVREKVLQATRQEVPHAVATYIENWEVEGSLTRVSAVILVETEGQKAIIIGQKGKMLKAIGTKARLDIEAMTGTKVYLELFVKVRTNWRGNMKLLHELELV